MSRNGTTDRELGVQKFNIRNPTDIDTAIHQLSRQEHRTKNNLYVVLLKEALAARGVVFDESNRRLPDEAVGGARVYLPIDRNNPAFYGEQVVITAEFHMHLPDEEGIHCTIEWQDDKGKDHTRLVALDELEPYWYIPRRRAVAEESSFKTASHIPKELL